MNDTRKSAFSNRSHTSLLVECSKISLPKAQSGLDPCWMNGDCGRLSFRSKCCPCELEYSDEDIHDDSSIISNSTVSTKSNACTVLPILFCFVFICLNILVSCLHESSMLESFSNFLKREIYSTQRNERDNSNRDLFLNFEIPIACNTTTLDNISLPLNANMNVSLFESTSTQVQNLVIFEDNLSLEELNVTSFRPVEIVNAILGSSAGVNALSLNNSDQLKTLIEVNEYASILSSNIIVPSDSLVTGVIEVKIEDSVVKDIEYSRSFLENDFKSQSNEQCPKDSGSNELFGQKYAMDMDEERNMILANHSEDNSTSSPGNSNDTNPPIPVLIDENISTSEASKESIKMNYSSHSSSVFIRKTSLRTSSPSFSSTLLSSRSSRNSINVRAVSYDVFCRLNGSSERLTSAPHGAAKNQFFPFKKYINNMYSTSLGMIVVKDESMKEHSSKKYCVSGSSGRISIVFEPRLLSTISGFGLWHVQLGESGTEEYDRWFYELSAPRDIQVFGLQGQLYPQISSREVRQISLGHYLYNTMSSPPGYFIPLNIDNIEQIDGMVEGMMFQFHSNYGNSQYTCIHQLLLYST